MNTNNRTIADAVSSELATALTLKDDKAAGDALAELCETLLKSLTLTLALVARGQQSTMGDALDATTNTMHEYAAEVLPAARMTTMAAQFARGRT